MSPYPTTLAILAAAFAWWVWIANVRQYRIRAAMTEEERKADDEEQARLSQEW